MTAPGRTHTQVQPPFRIGQGYDLHRLEFDASGPGLVLSGVPIAHPCRVIAHSDGDVVLHALTDALLGALGEPDIGQLFPDTDPVNRQRDSAAFVSAALGRVHAHGYRVGNVDATIVLQAPKVGAHKLAMRARMAQLLEVDVARVNVKGKTGEGLGPIGEGKAVEAHVVVLLERVQPGT